MQASAIVDILNTYALQFSLGNYNKRKRCDNETVCKTYKKTPITNETITRLTCTVVRISV